MCPTVNPGQNRWPPKKHGGRDPERPIRTAAGDVPCRHGRSAGGQDRDPVTAGPRGRHNVTVNERATTSPVAVSVAVGPLAATAVLILVMFAVRRDDPGAAGATALALLLTGGIGAIVAVRRPDHPCGWLLVVLSMFAAAGAASTDYVQASLAAAERYPYTTAVGWITTWAATPAIPLAALVLLTFPTGRLPSHGWRLLAVAVVIAGVVRSVAIAVTPGPLPVAGDVVNPLGVEVLAPLMDGVAGVAGGVAGVVIVAAVVRLVVRYRRAEGVERDQLRLLARALPVAVAGVVAALVVSGPLNEASFYFAVIGLTAIPVAIGWAVLRHGLLEIDVLVNRALVYGSLTIIVVGVYVAVVAGLGQALRESTELGVSVVATAVVAVAFAPLRDRLQRRADRLMYGDRSDPYVALARLGRRLEDAAAPADALPMTAEVVGRSLKLRAVEVQVLHGRALETAATWGEPGTERAMEALDLIHGRELVGQLCVWPRPGESLSAKDQTLLAALCAPAAVVAHATAVGRELQQSRDSLVRTREEERRRLRADLHDGLGPELAGVTFALAAARNTLRSDPVAVEALLDQLQEQVRSAVTQVRSLVDGLAPVVDQLGLAGALQQGVSRLSSTAGIAVHLHIEEDVPPLPAAVEIAAYRIAMEALTNVVRHADASQCTVHVSYHEGVHIDVTDDGKGLPATVVPGVGLSSMRRRSQELGGSCSVEPAPGGGTRVCAMLPAA